VVGVVFPLTLISAMKTRVSEAQQWLYRHLGDLSYPLYITHVPFFWLAAGALKILFPAVPAVWFGLIILPASIVFAYGVFYLYDKPIRAVLRRRLLAEAFEKPAHGH
jgi:peptidoglycan/LPS O-acetylase OafA/YrhL